MLRLVVQLAAAQLPKAALNNPKTKSLSLCIFDISKIFIILSPLYILLAGDFVRPKTMNLISKDQAFLLKRNGKSNMSMDHSIFSSGSNSDTNMIISNKKSDQLDDHDLHENRNKAKRHALVSFRELPEYMKDNEFIVGYYRANWPLKEALFSIFRWHNETINVWTHLIGFILFVGLTVANLVQVPQVADLISVLTRSFSLSAKTNISHNSKQIFVGAANLVDLNLLKQVDMDITPPIMPITRWPFFVFLGGSMSCLLSSSICHLLSCHSHHLNRLLLQIDYVGITVMIITSFFPPIFYIFQCDQHWQFIYLGGITVMGIFTILTLLTPSLSTGKCRAFRSFLFCSMGLFGIVPAVHACIVNWSNPRRNITLAYEVAMAVFYLTGTGFYVSRIPERWKPGWFDLAGHSHQIFHLLVVMGALAHYGATLLFLEWRDHVGCL